jgi:hypothetical protein
MVAGTGYAGMRGISTLNCGERRTFTAEEQRTQRKARRLTQRRPRKDGGHRER